MDERLAFAVGACFYGLAFLLGLFQLMRKKPYPYQAVGLIVLGGFLAQTLGLYARGQQVRSCPIGNPFEIFQFISWSLVTVYGIVGSAFRMSLLGFFSSALAAALSLSPFFISGWDATYGARIFTSALMESHAALSIFSYGVFGLLTLTSAMLLFQNYGLKQKRFEGLFANLPSIVELETVNTRLLVTAMLVYTAAVLLGMTYLREETGTITHLKLVFALVIWACYGLALFLRWRQRLIGARLARVCIALFLLALAGLYPVEISRQPHETPAGANMYSDV